MNQIKTQNYSVYLMWTCSESEIRLAKMHMHKTLIIYIHHLEFLKICKYLLWMKCSSPQSKTMLDLLKVHYPTKISFYMLWEYHLYHYLSHNGFFATLSYPFSSSVACWFSHNCNWTSQFPIICEVFPLFAPYTSCCLAMVLLPKQFLLKTLLFSSISSLDKISLWNQVILSILHVRFQSLVCKHICVFLGLLKWVVNVVR